jgi:hypothetical protein
MDETRSSTWQIEDHPCDACLLVRTGRLVDLFPAAARAFGAWVAGESPDARAATPRPPQRVERLLEFSISDPLESWIQFWRTLHRLLTVEGWLATDAELLPARPDHLRLRLILVAADTLRLDERVDVKAVTRHRALVAMESPDRWLGRILLDL